ncbi:MAG: transposase family protein [Paenibacillaceae bacterium]|jgi:hypothetical protein|nr:transposase family protein [Paenibacillaceae bacterium]
MNQMDSELKRRIVERLMPPNEESVSRMRKRDIRNDAVQVEEGSLGAGRGNARWRKIERALEHPGEVRHRGGDRRFSEIELSEYCRVKGLYVEQVAAWRDACMQANGGVAEQASKLQKVGRPVTSACIREPPKR